jgi:hypothetical protein
MNALPVTPMMFTFSVPVFDRRLTAHAAILDKAAAHAEANGIAPLTLLEDRLYPDMFPYWLQVHSACNHAANCTARLTGAPLPVLDETPKTFAGLKTRIAHTLTYINAADPTKFAGAETRPLLVRIAGREREMNGLDYFQNSALPNFYFHLTTAYGILRKNGIPVGKRDFLGNND